MATKKQAAVVPAPSTPPRGRFAVRTEYELPNPLGQVDKVVIDNPTLTDLDAMLRATKQEGDMAGSLELVRRTVREINGDPVHAAALKGSLIEQYLSAGQVLLLAQILLKTSGMDAPAEEVDAIIASGKAVAS